MFLPPIRQHLQRRPQLRNPEADQPILPHLIVAGRAAAEVQCCAVLERQQFRGTRECGLSFVAASFGCGWSRNFRV